MKFFFFEQHNIIFNSHFSDSNRVPFLADLQLKALHVRHSPSTGRAFRSSVEFRYEDSYVKDKLCPEHIVERQSWVSAPFWASFMAGPSGCCVF